MAFQDNRASRRGPVNVLKSRAWGAPPRWPGVTGLA